MTPDMLRLINEQRGINKDLDRRKPITSPSVFNNDSARPPASKNPRRIIFVRQADGSFRGQYSDGANWQTFLATVVSFATPLITYGTTFSAGSSVTTIRSDAQLKYPTALMSATSSGTITATDNTTEQTLTGSLGNFILVAGGSGGLIFDTDPTPAVQTAIVRVRPANGNLTGMSASYFSGNVATTVNQTVRVWDAQVAHTSGKIGDSAGGFNATLVASDISVLSATPAAGSGTANAMYGFRSTGPLINNATGSWADVTTVSLGGPRRLISNPTVTISKCLELECPTISATSQIGLYIKQRTAQQTATNRYGILIDTHNSGTNRWGLQCAEKIENTATDLMATASAKGFIGQYSDQAGRYFRLRGLYNGGAPSLTIDDVGTVLPVS